MKAYLDTNIVSSIVKEDNPSQKEALACLLRAFKEGKVDLVRSEVTDEEIKKVPPAHLPKFQRILQQLEKVETVRWDELQGITSAHIDYRGGELWMHQARIKNDPLYDQLLASGLEVTDSKHLFLAAKQNCNAFLTCDNSPGTSILRRAGKIEELLKIKVQRPSEFVDAHGIN